MLLGLDISTSTIGWSVLDKKGSLIDYGYIQPKGENLFEKLQDAEQKFLPVLKKHKIDIIGAEEAAKKFTPGKSSADTITKLVSINFGICNFFYRELKLTPNYITATSARKNCGIKVPRGSNAKKIVRDFVANKYPNIVWEKKKTGNFKDYCFDIADSIVISEAIRLTLTHE